MNHLSMIKKLNALDALSFCDSAYQLSRYFHKTKDLALYPLHQLPRVIKIGLIRQTGFKDGIDTRL